MGRMFQLTVIFLRQRPGLRVVLTEQTDHANKTTIL